MDMKEVLCMNEGEGDNSYVNGGVFPRKVAVKVQPLLDNAVRALVLKNSHSHGLLNIADLGCATGPKTLALISSVVDTVKKTCQEINCKTPDLQIYLNLVGNDFNLLFRDLSRVGFQDENMSCFVVMGAPGFRSKEMTAEGLAVLVFHGRESVDPADGEAFNYWEQLAQAFSDLVSEEEKLDSFNMPYSKASKEEVIDIVEREGSFTIEHIETFAIDNVDKEDKDIQSQALK
ncbi:SAM dependent carboxyl methyltransferase [Dillenia turbinata]|uniref:SAM dependent carboxyl methyltransferase n=1 Tax=Dillenia turbinata TaxID=194707 RepID=A0AAN8VNV6_9MAGN